MFKFKPIYKETITSESKPEYIHGFSTEEVEELEKQYLILERRDKVKFPLTLAEQEIVFKVCRIRRTEEFILQKQKPVKVPKPKKEKVVKEKIIKEKIIKEKVVKVKKKTKKELQIEHSKMMTLLFKRNMGKELSEEENTWLDAKLEEIENE